MIGQTLVWFPVGGDVMAFDRATLARRWVLPHMAGATLTPRGDQLLAQYPGALMLFDADGRRLWRVTPYANVGAGAAWCDDDGIWVLSAGAVLSLDPADGAVRWMVRLGSLAKGRPCRVGDRLLVVTSPNDQLMPDALTALSASTGEVLYRHEIARDPEADHWRVHGQPIEWGDGTVMLARTESMLGEGEREWFESYDAATGRRVSVHEVADALINSADAWRRVGSSLVGIEYNGSALFDARDGRVLWQPERHGALQNLWVTSESLLWVLSDNLLEVHGDDGGARQLGWMDEDAISAVADGRSLYVLDASGMLSRFVAD